MVGGLLVGAALGGIVGLLFAPRRGQDTRHLLKKSADALPELVEDLSGNLQIQAGRLSAAAIDRWEETLDRLRGAIAAGLAASQAVDEPLDRPSTDQISPTKTLRYSQLTESANTDQAQDQTQEHPAKT